MKFCDDCGARIPSKSKFCPNCGERCVEILPSSPEVVERTAHKKRTRPISPEIMEEARLEPRRNKSERAKALTVVQRVKSVDEKPGAPASAFGASLWNLLVATWRLIVWLLRPLVLLLVAALRETIYKALAPASTWDANKIPNFLLWGILEALVWRLPFSVVGIIYAVLANDARKNEDFEVARDRAERAKNWLLFDLGVGIIFCVFKNLVKVSFFV